MRVCLCYACRCTKHVSTVSWARADNETYAIIRRPTLFFPFCICPAVYVWTSVFHFVSLRMTLSIFLFWLMWYEYMLTDYAILLFLTNTHAEETVPRVCVNICRTAKALFLSALSINAIWSVAQLLFMLCQARDRINRQSAYVEETERYIVKKAWEVAPTATDRQLIDK